MLKFVWVFSLFRPIAWKSSPVAPRGTAISAIHAVFHVAWDGPDFLGSLASWGLPGVRVARRSARACSELRASRAERPRSRRRVCVMRGWHGRPRVRSLRTPGPAGSPDGSVRAVFVFPCSSRGPSKGSDPCVWPPWSRHPRLPRKRPPPGSPLRHPSLQVWTSPHSSLNTPVPRRLQRLPWALTAPLDQDRSGGKDRAPSPTPHRSEQVLGLTSWARPGNSAWRQGWGEHSKAAVLGVEALRLRGSRGPGPFIHTFQGKSLWNQELKAVRNARDLPLLQWAVCRSVSWEGSLYFQLRHTE